MNRADYQAFQRMLKVSTREDNALNLLRREILSQRNAPPIIPCSQCEVEKSQRNSHALTIGFDSISLVSGASVIQYLESSRGFNSQRPSTSSNSSTVSGSAAPRSSWVLHSLSSGCEFGSSLKDLVPRSSLVEALLGREGDLSNISVTTSNIGKRSSTVSEGATRLLSQISFTRNSVINTASLGDRSPIDMQAVVDVGEVADELNDFNETATFTDINSIISQNMNLGLNGLMSITSSRQASAGPTFSLPIRPRSFRYGDFASSI